MKHEQEVTDWLEQNTDLAWTRIGGDRPSVKLDRQFINRSEGYEIRYFILKYYEECNLVHKSENYRESLKKIMDYKSGEKVETQDLLDHLTEGLKK